MTCDAECRSLSTSSSAFVGNVAACISSCVDGIWPRRSARAPPDEGREARALRRTPANNMARRIGVGGRLEQRLCPCRSVSPFQGSSRSAAGSRGRTGIKQPCDRPQQCQRVTPVELHVGVSPDSKQPCIEGEGLNWKGRRQPKRARLVRTDRKEAKTPACGSGAKATKQMPEGRARIWGSRAARRRERHTHKAAGGMAPVLRSSRHPEPPLLLIGVLILLAVNTYVVWQWRHRRIGTNGSQLN